MAMSGAAFAHHVTTATREESGQQRAGRTRCTSADPQRAQQGATAAAAAAPAALDSLSRLQQLADASSQVAQLRRLQALADAHYAPVSQLAGTPEEEELIQGKFATVEFQPQRQQAPRTNNSGLPDQLKSGIESLSGLSMDPVRVHYNSAQPAQLNALAYAQGSEIHVAPGQEQHLPHQAWHVVQQTQGQVRPTLQLKDGVQVNDDAGLEREADVMGSKALVGGHRAVETHRSISMPIDTAQRIEGDALNSPEAIVANNHSAPLANGQGWAQRGGNEMQRIAYQCAQAALQRQVQAWGDGSDRVEELRVWQRVADGRGVGGKSQDLTPGFTAQRQAQERGGHLSTQLASSPRQLAQRHFIGQMLGSAVQRVEGELDEEEGGAAQLRSEPVQRVEGGLDEEEPPAPAQLRAEPAQRQENRTGMPDGLKAGIESLSGMDMSDVRVHHNSSQPAQLNALAYAQGNDIHLGPGQEQHLPHEAWHVVQQRQGRVQATMQMAGVGVNDDVGLEREADVMGGRAVQFRGGQKTRPDPEAMGNSPRVRQLQALADMMNSSPRVLAQRQWMESLFGGAMEDERTIQGKFQSGHSNFQSVLQAQWVTVDKTGERLKLKKTDHPDIFELSSDGSRYRVVRREINGTIGVEKMQENPHSQYRFDNYGPYKDWSTSSQGIELDTPFGGKVSAYHNRGAPKIGSRKEEFGGAKLGDAYSDYIAGLRSQGLPDDKIATALLELDDSVIASELEQRAGAMLHTTVYLAEEWRKQGAAKIYRALLRLIAKGSRTFDDFLSDFKFIQSADDGRTMVARIYDVFKGVVDKSELPGIEEEIYDAMSQINNEDFSSDEEKRDEDHKDLKSKSRLHAQHHKGEKGWKDPW